MINLAQVSSSIGSRFLAALAYRDYRTMWLATMSAGGAAWALIVARGWLVFTLSESSALVGVVTFAAMIPLLFVPPFAGYLADRIDRRKILAWVFAVQIGHGLALAVLAFTGEIEVWHLVVLSFLNGTVRAAQMSASQALIPNLVPPDKMQNAVALNSATQHASRLTGPLLIAPLMATAGTSWAFVLCTALYCISFVTVLRVRTVSTGVMEPHQSAVRQFFAGMEYVYHNPLILSVVVLVVLHCSLTMAFESLIPVLTRERLGMGGEGFAYVMIATGTGALVMVVTLAGVQKERARGRLLLWLGVISGISPLAFAAATSVPMALLAAAVMGGSQAGFMLITAVIIQSLVPDGIRGRVMSIYLLHIGGMMALFNLSNGVMADLFNAPLVLTVTGSVFVVVMAVSLLRAPLRRLYAEGLPVEAQARWNALTAV